MNMSTLDTLDYIVFAVYCALIIFIGLWVSRDKKGHEKNSSDYFLASRSLPWWAIGASLIASNISAEQIIGMSGSGFKMGLAISTYEWMAAATLIIVGKYFMPIFLKKQIFTMPQFLEQRYDGRVRSILAIFWLLLYVFVNLTSVLYLGSLPIITIMEGVNVYVAIGGLALFAVLYSIYGGLSAVAWTDVIQVVMLVAGGIITTWLALEIVGDGSVSSGMGMVYEEANSHFHMIFSSDNPNYMDLPGVTLLIGGMWIVNLNYWGCNQYITQRALAAKSLNEAQKGIVFAGFLKLIVPLIVVLPGIATYVLLQREGAIDMDSLLLKDGAELAGGSFSEKMFDPLQAGGGKVMPDRAYPTLLSILPVGLKGAAFAALVAAVVSSLASMMNSTATIFTMDIYKNYINKNASEKRLVAVGRGISVVAIVIAVIVAPLLGTIEQAFQYIQEYTGLVSPGIFVIFFYGFFWKKATTSGALWVAVLTLPLSLAIKFGFPNIPFLDRMGLVFFALSLVMYVVSVMESKGLKIAENAMSRIGIYLVVLTVSLLVLVLNNTLGWDMSESLVKTLIHLAFVSFTFVVYRIMTNIKDNKHAIDIDKSLFKTHTNFNIASVVIIILLVILYTVFW
ncbi:sodium/sugar symporter [Flammeovirgaceae bacterium SG7u.111]|nr:sodium/sugar symporter [Flammeovirgaceae bacterium SG7u.132]WPO35970.1 sodium/sugar symporter [Flammeovirgaceae bacterium SG7u.111]